jgi:4-amino-4-deoxy-L-arabinose transferase-like glycosyltransferase
MTSPTVAPFTPAAADDRAPDLTARQFFFWLLVVFAVAALLRGVFPVADPPWRASVGIVWHDEGAWVHNARNRALFGAWQLDHWNPMFLAPVFAGLEYVSFRLFGVGLWQARLVSEVAGWLTIPLLAFAVRAVASRRAALTAAAFLATNYVWVWWNRAALMESTMVAFMVASACAYAQAHRHRWWGVAAGVFAMLAFFTKAAAAFFLAALALECVVRFLVAGTTADVDERRRHRQSAVFTLAGLTVAALVALVWFVGPYWQEFRFYNWQMSVVRKPSYTLRAFLDRASWLPIIHDFFTRMWVVLLLAVGGLFSVALRWRTSNPVERLFAFWILIGVAELFVHDVGNERRLVFLIPPMVGLAAMVLAGQRGLLPERAARVSRGQLLAASPVVLYALYVLAGSWVRLGWLYQVKPGVYAAAAAALLLGAGLLAFWPRVTRAVAGPRWSVGAITALAVIVVAGDVTQFAQWAAGRTSYNYEVMKEIGRTLPPDTLVHGKLANGLSLESRIRPVFVGRGFGNYDDRLARPDVRYLLTYRRPFMGYEGRVINDVLDGYRWHVVRRFRVAESASGDDEVILVVKDGLLAK